MKIKRDTLKYDIMPKLKLLSEYSECYEVDLYTRVTQTFDVTENEHAKKQSLGCIGGQNYNKNYIRSHILTFLLGIVCWCYPEEFHNH